MGIALCKYGHRRAQFFQRMGQCPEKGIDPEFTWIEAEQPRPSGRRVGAATSPTVLGTRLPLKGGVHRERARPNAAIMPNLHCASAVTCLR
jgi:hypothetical protein